MAFLTFFVSVFLFTFISNLSLLVVSQGLTLDECSSDRDCASTRRCLDTSGESCAGSFSCRCFPLRPVSCLSDDVCPEGEICVVLSSTAVCVSEKATENAAVEPVTQPNPTAGGVTGESCSRNRDCLAPRICVRADDSIELCVGKFSCFCVPPVFQECEVDSDCPKGEACGLGEIPVCVIERDASVMVQDIPKPTAVADPDFVEDVVENGNPETIVVAREVCVAERHLKGVENIYETGRFARVLCDSLGSCATPGHLVLYDGKGMMMRSYCDVVGCKEGIMKVNSPRWERQLRVKSWSDGLEFTAFAARYETAAEEMVLAGAVRAGL